MKNYKRALRRWKKESKFKKRVKIWTQGTYSHNPQKRDQWIKEILEGKSHTFLKTISTRCSCWMCTYEKYERTPKSKINKEIWNQLLE